MGYLVLVGAAFTAIPAALLLRSERTTTRSGAKPNNAAIRCSALRAR
jgi:hypothetical protein